MYFSDCIQRDRDPEPGAAEGLADVRVIEALERSIETGRPVSIDAPPPAVRRPALDQELRRPPVGRPSLVHASPP